MTLDPRLNVVRPDLAAESLRGVAKAGRYAWGSPMTVAVALAPLRRQPDRQAPLLTEALHGEPVQVYERAHGWAWVQLETDQYVGYIPDSALVQADQAPTHTVAAPKTFVYPEPSLKAPPIGALYLTARVTVTASQNGYAKLADGGYVHWKHLTDEGPLARDPAAVAEDYVGVPYLWGGKSHEGLDCSGLVQLALQAAGIACPRDSDMIEASVGACLPAEGKGALRRGDLVFWKGHVGMMLDEARIIHANGHHMKVVIEPFGEALFRIASQYGEVTGFRRPA